LSENAIPNPIIYNKQNKSKQKINIANRNLKPNFDKISLREIEKDAVNRGSSRAILLK
jgi:hypothetical protein